MCDDRLDVWVLRQQQSTSTSDTAQRSYPGPGRLELCPTSHALLTAKSLWLLGGTTADPPLLQAAFPALAAKPNETMTVVQLQPWLKL